MKALRVAALIVAVATAAEAQSVRSKVGEQPQVPQSRQEKTFPLGVSWVAVSLNGKPFSGDRPAFTINQQYRATGFGGCNTFAATAYPLREQRIAVGPLALTKRACDRAAMENEQAFLVALRTAAQWDLVGTSLVMRGQNGELRFDRAI